MRNGLALNSEPAALLACTISRTLVDFDLLVEDMEAEFGTDWGDLRFDEARTFLLRPEAETMLLIAIALDEQDEGDVGLLAEIIRAARDRDIRVILVADGVSPATLHQLLKVGADDFLPYPFANGALHNAVSRRHNVPTKAAPAMTAAAQPTAKAPASAHPPPTRAVKHGNTAAVFAVQNLAGGTGASTLAVNMAWELANVDRKAPHSVCLIDLDLQFGAISAYLDVPCRDAVDQYLQEAARMDVDAFRQALTTFQTRLSVFTAPSEILPLDLVGPEEVDALIGFASNCFDIVVIDMPRTLVTWTETVLNRADVYFTTLELDLRSAQDAMRFIKVLRAEDLPLEKIQFVLNRAPGGMDLAGKGRVKKLADSLGVQITTLLPDGGKQVMQAGDHGQPLAEVAKKNPLRKEIARLAQGLHKAMITEAAAK